MKTLKRIITLALLTIGMNTVTAEVPPPPGDDPTGSGNPVGTGAPIGGGMAMLLAMGAAYGGKKMYDYRKKIRNEMEE